MGYRVADEKKDVVEPKSGGIPTMYLMMARFNLASLVRERGKVVDRGRFAKELGLPLNHEDVYRAAYGDVGLLDEFLAEARRLEESKVGTRFYRPDADE